MNNKVLIEEINRVREVMGLPVMAPPNNSKVILEVVNPGYWAKILKILNGGKYAHKGLATRLVVKGGPVEAVLTKNDDFFWKVKNKYSDELTDVNTMDELLDRLVDAPNSITTKNIMRDLFMDNPETRALIANAADNLVGGLSKLDNMAEIETFLANMEELGIAIDLDDLAKVADDIFLKSADNPIRVAFKNSGTISKNLFGKSMRGKLFKKTTSTNVEKGVVIIDVMGKLGLKTSDDAYEFFLKIGLNEADAAKIKIAIEKGISADANKIDEIFSLLAKSDSNEIQLTFIDVVSNNKFLRDKIRTTGANGKMSSKEIRAFLGLGDEATIPLSLIDDIADMVGVKRVRRILPRKSAEYFDPDKGWYYQYLIRKRIEGLTWSKTSFKMVKGLFNLIWFYHIIPISLWYTTKEDSWDITKYFFGDPEGTFDCDKNSKPKCFLAPSAQDRELTKRPGTITLYLQNTDGNIDKVYLDLAEKIGLELGTLSGTTWYTETTLPEGGEMWDKSVDEDAISGFINSRPSLLGITAIATAYYDKTSRQLYDDMDLMKFEKGSYGEWLTGKWKKFSKIPYVNIGDTGKEIFNDIVNKPLRTIKDTTNPVVDVDAADAYDTLFKFPKNLWVTDNSGKALEKWQCCYKGPMPPGFVNTMSSAEEISTMGDFNFIDPNDFNRFYKKYAAAKYQVKDNAYLPPLKEVEINGVKKKVYSPRGTTECGTPSELKGLSKSELSQKVNKAMDDFMNLLSTQKQAPSIEDVVNKTD